MYCTIRLTLPNLLQDTSTRNTLNKEKQITRALYTTEMCPLPETCPFPHFPNVHERQVKACHPGRCLKLAAALPNKTASKKQSTGIWDGTGKHSFRHFFSDCVCSILSNWPCAIGTLDIDQEKKTKSHVPPSHMHMMSKLGFFPFCLCWVLLSVIILWKYLRDWLVGVQT